MQGAAFHLRPFAIRQNLPYVADGRKLRTIEPKLMPEKGNPRSEKPPEGSVNEPAEDESTKKLVYDDGGMKIVARGEWAVAEWTKIIEKGRKHARAKKKKFWNWAVSFLEEHGPARAEEFIRSAERRGKKWHDERAEQAQQRINRNPDRMEREFDLIDKLGGRLVERSNRVKFLKEVLDRYFALGEVPPKWEELNKEERAAFGPKQTAAPAYARAILELENVPPSDFSGPMDYIGRIAEHKPDGRGSAVTLGAAERFFRRAGLYHGADEPLSEIKARFEEASRRELGR